MSTPTPTTTEVNATAMALSPPGSAAARPAVHTVPSTSGTITATSARMRRKTRTNAADASTIARVPEISRSRVSISSVAAAMAWPPVSPRVTAGCSRPRGSITAATSSTKAFASAPRSDCPAACTSTMRMPPSSLEKAPSGCVFIPPPRLARSKASCESRSGSCVTTSARAPLPGASRSARVSRSRARMPSGVSAAAMRARPPGSA